MTPLADLAHRLAGRVPGAGSITLRAKVCVARLAKANGELCRCCLSGDFVPAAMDLAFTASEMILDMELMPSPDEIIKAIAEERNRQDQKWGANRQLRDDTWASIAGEEVGEVAEAVLGAHPDEDLLAEIIQVVAVGIAIPESRDQGA